MSDVNNKKITVNEAIVCSQHNYTNFIDEIYKNPSLVNKLDEQQCKSAIIGLMKELKVQYDLRDALKEESQVIKRRTDAKSQFVAALSHELRTPLNAVIGITRLLSEDVDIMSPKHRSHVNLLYSSASTAITLVNQVLDITRIEQNILEIEKKPFNLLELIATLALAFRPLAESKGLNAHIEVYGNIPLCVTGDKDRIVQLLINLGSNAAKYTKTGGFVLEIRSETHLNQSQITFKLRDTGIGITPDRIKELRANRYVYRSDNGRNGLGLGLFIVKGLSRAMGGTFKIDSKLDQGTVVTFKLPINVNQTHLLKCDTDPFCKKEVIACCDNELTDSQLTYLQSKAETRCHAMPIETLLLFLANNPGRQYPLLIATADQLTVLHNSCNELDICMPSFCAVCCIGDYSQAIYDYLISTTTWITFIKTTPLEIDQLAYTAHCVVHDRRCGGSDSGEFEGAPLHILLIEDEGISQMTLEEAAKLRGHKVTIASTGAEASVALNNTNNSFDVAIIDAHLPDCMGYDLIELCLLNNIRHTYMATADATVEAKYRAISAGVKGFITKPFDPVDLIRQIETPACEIVRDKRGIDIQGS